MDSYGHKIEATVVNTQSALKISFRLECDLVFVLHFAAVDKLY